jgi:hypothetical protein
MQRKLVDRVRAIILRPKEEWLVIDKEQTDVTTLFRTYVAPLAAIPPIATFLGTVIFGAPYVGVARPTVGGAFFSALVSYVLSLVGVYIVARVIDYLAPRNGGQPNPIQAFKVSAYSSTPSWIAGIFSLVPALSALGILGLYGVYLLYLGLPALMKVPQEKATGYTIGVIAVTIAVYVVIFIITGIVLGIGAVATL